MIHNGKKVKMILKFVQEYQVDQAARAQIKLKYREDDPVKETQYWDYVKSTSLEIVNSIVVKSRKLPDLLEELSLILKKYTITFEHNKKTVTNIKDDIQLSAKTLLIKKLKGNNNALILGKFRVLSKGGHYKLIKRAMTLYDNVVVCIVTSSDTKDTKDLRTKMMQTVFPDVEIIHSTNGNLSRILQNSPINVNVVYAGTDRVKSYQDQLKNTLGVDVKELQRTDSDISASKIINNIEDEEFFKANTPKELHSMYKTILSVYKK